MSSILQHTGSITRRGVGLEFYLVRHQPTEYGYNKEIPIEKHRCTICNGTHPRLYVAYRKPAGQWGHWAVFRINGEEKVPDLSHPMATDRIPRDAIRLSDVQSSRAWHDKDPFGHNAKRGKAPAKKKTTSKKKPARKGGER